jgi:SAM-dependent methyltransferase
MGLAGAVRYALRAQGIRGVAREALDRGRGRGMALASAVREVVEGASCLEIGGPSTARFAGGRLVPVYPYVSRIENVNFAGATLWEKDLRDGGPYAPAGAPVGVQYLREATDLHGLDDDAYDVVISSHTLEHLANPLKALREWRRVCRPGGHLVLIVPHRDGTFDRRRPVTSLEHMQQDEKNDVGESDTTHVEEILRLHDLRRDPGAASEAIFRARLADNLATRGMHQHVFDLRRAVDVVAESEWAPLCAEARRPHDIAVLAVNGPADGPPRNFGSPFPSDRQGG